ncbi:class I SAM-dependent methyltransferase [soil metagenome]
MFPFDNDPLGQALLDYHNGDHSVQVTVRSDIAEEDVLQVSYLFRSFSQLPEREVKALELCRGRVLDVGAGAGAHTLLLQERGFEVLAVDVSAGAGEVMKARGVRSVRQVNVFGLQEGPFDTILMLMNGIGIVGDLVGLDRFLEQAKQLLSPQGQIIVESSDILFLYEEEDGSVLLDLNAPYYGEMEYQMEYRGIEGIAFKWLFVDFQTLQDHAQTCGYGCEYVIEEEQGHFIARLSLNDTLSKEEI